MKLTFEEQLPNLIEGVVHKISTETDYVVKENGDHLNVEGLFIVTREVKAKSRTTEIKDYIPIFININKKNLINKKEEIYLYLDGFRFEFDLKRTRVYGDLELTNVNEKYSKEENLVAFGVFD